MKRLFPGPRASAVTPTGSDRPSDSASGALELVALRKEYEGSTAVADVTLTVRAGEFVSLLGSSGSGKSTTLLMIAGFERETSGQLWLDGRSLNGVPAHHRNVGMMFQRYSLFPHMSVEQNIAYPLKIRGLSRDEVARKVNEALELVHLEGYGKRFPNQLSGGQQQRVALARATVYRPRLLLMDEPLSALDRSLRATMQEEIRRIHRDLGTTVIYVTHDQEEALALSDRIVLMHNGCVEQVGTPSDLYHRSATVFAAQFVGESTRLAGRVLSSRGDGTVDVELHDGSTVRGIPAHPFSDGDAVVVIVRPERLAILDPGCQSQVVDSVPVVVEEVTFLGESVRIHGRCKSGDRTIVRVDARRALAWERGDEILVGWDPQDARVLAT